MIGILKVLQARLCSYPKSSVIKYSVFSKLPTHTIYIRNNMGQKCEGNCGLWVLHEILKKTYPENLKKIVGAVWELPAR